MVGRDMFALWAHHVSPAAKRSLARGILAGAATLAVYLLVVVATTPNLPPAAAIAAAFAINSIVMAGSAGAIGAQVFFATYAKSIGCPLGRGGTLLGAGSRGTTAAGSFFSFFSLVPLGCCGSWLFILSLLPSVFGSGLAAALITYSQPLSYAGLAAVLGFAALSGAKLYGRLARAA